MISSQSSSLCLEEGTFQWANGDPFTFTQWGEGEPNNNGDEVIMTNLSMTMTMALIREAITNKKSSFYGHFP